MIQAANLAPPGAQYPTDIRPLTSLRIAAALWVLVYHFRSHLGLDLGRYGLIAKGYLGVDLFFILSGFILSHVYVRSWQEGRFKYGSFLWARLARVYPVHLVTLAGTMVIWLAAIKLGAQFEPSAFDPKVLPQHLLLIHAWGTTPWVQWNFPSWSISAEWFAYLLFPLAAAASLWFGRSAASALFGVLAAAGVFAAMFMVAEHQGVLFTDMTAQIGALRIIPSFLMGAALHRLGSSLSLPRLAAWAGVWGALAWISFAATAKLSDLFIWPGLAVMIFSLAETAKSDPRSYVTLPIFVYLGEVSYAVYMTHLPVDIAYFHTLEKVAPNLSGPAIWLAWSGVFFVCLLVSMATYHLVERPARNWLRAHDPFRGRLTS